MCASLLHMGRERERAEADRIWEAHAPETCQIRSVAAMASTSPFFSSSTALREAILLRGHHTAR